MATKCAGAEFKAFYQDDKFWPEEAHVDEMVILVDGSSVPEDFDVEKDLIDNSIVTIVDGWVLDFDASGDGISLKTHFKRWRKAQQTVTLAVSIDKARVSELEAAIKAVGGKLHK